MGETNECSTPASESKKRELSSPLDFIDSKKSKTAESHIMLSGEDIQAIADVLKDTFNNEYAVDVDAQVQAILDGVLAGLNTKIRNLEDENEKLRTRVSKLERDADNAEQYSRRNCLRFSGVPESRYDQNKSADSPDQESDSIEQTDDPPSHHVDDRHRTHEFTDGKILDIMRALDVDVHISDIDRSHRIGIKKNGRPRDIIVNFSTYRVRNAVYRARVGLKTGGYSGVFVNEDLTRMRAALFYKARQLAKGHFFHSAWTYDGMDMVKDFSRKVHRITCENDLMNVKSSKPMSVQPPNTFGSTSHDGVDLNVD